MAEYPKMPLWTDAYLADTSHLTTIEHGAYLLLLMAMWRAGGSLPNDDRLLARYARLTGGQWKRIKPVVMQFFSTENEVITQSRLTDELSFVRQKSKTQSDNARAKSRKNKGTGAATAEPNGSHGTPPIPISNTNLTNAHAREHGSFIPSDWKPDARDLMEAGKYFDDERVALEAEKFRDHYQTVPGERGRSRDWSIQWRKWIRRAFEFDGQNAKRTKRNGTSPADARANPLREATREFLADHHPGGGGVSTQPVAEPLPDAPAERRLAGSGRGLQPVALSLPKIEGAGGD